MARRIAWLVAATTSAVVVAFVVPLCFLIANIAEDRGTTRAREQAQSVATLVATLDDTATLSRTVADLSSRGPRWSSWSPAASCSAARVRSAPTRPPRSSAPAPSRAPSPSARTTGWMPWCRS